MSLGLIELVGHTKGARYILSHQYYEFVGKPGEHIRLRGLSTEVRRKTILELIRKNGKVTNSELQNAMPSLKATAITTTLVMMQKDGIIKRVGARKFGYWVLDDEPAQLSLLNPDK